MGVARTRRRFLRGVGGAALALPFFASLSGRGHAAPGDHPKRIVFVYIPQGETPDFFPQVSGSSFSLDATYLSPLEAFKDELLLFHNLKGTSGHYEGHSECLTGWPNKNMQWFPENGPSIDQLLANRMKNDVSLASLHMTMQSESSAPGDDNTISWTESGLAVPPMYDPRMAFEHVFGPLGGTGPDPTAEALERARKLKLSLLDSLIQDYKRLNQKLTPKERWLLDQHLTLIHEQEQKLLNEMPFDCGDPGEPPVEDPSVQTEWDEGNWQLKAKGYMDTIVASLRCDATRVVTLMFGCSQEDKPYTWLPEWDPSVINFHEVSHQESSNWQEVHFAYRKWQVEQVAYLADKLASVPEGDGTLLDSTAIVWLNELGHVTGPNQNPHGRGKCGGMIIGGMGGTFDVGRVVDLGGQAYPNLLLTLVHAMGYTDVPSIGDGGTKVLSELLV